MGRDPKLILRMDKSLDPNGKCPIDSVARLGDNTGSNFFLDRENHLDKGSKLKNKVPKKRRGNIVWQASDDLGLIYDTVDP
jgi:hypothetical protein